MSASSVSPSAFTAQSYSGASPKNRRGSAQPNLNAQVGLGHDEVRFSSCLGCGLKSLSASAKKTPESQNEKQREAKHLGLIKRAWRLVTTPFSAVYRAFTNGAKAVMLSLLGVGALAAFKQKKAALALGALSFMTVPLIAVGSGVGRIFKNLKEAITGRSAS